LFYGPLQHVHGFKKIHIYSLNVSELLTG